MPSTEAPGYYDRSNGDIATGDMLQFFRNVSEMEFTEETGRTEAPVGWVGLLNVDADLICRMTKECLPSDQFFDAVPSPGWYVVRRDDNGLVWGLQYGYGTHAEEQARADFREAEDTYQIWCDTDEQGNYVGDSESEGGVLKFAPGEVWLDVETGEFTREV